MGISGNKGRLANFPDGEFLPPLAAAGDGACTTSTATSNPSLTYRALTARAVDHAGSLFGHT